MFYSALKIFFANKRTQYVFYLIFYLFFVFPVILQSIFHYEYEGFWKANAALNDNFATGMYYCFIAIFSTYFVLRKKKEKYNVVEYERNQSLLSKFSICFILFTTLFTIATNGISIIFAGFGARLNNSNYSINEQLISISMILYLFLFFKDKKINYKKIIIPTLCILLLMWIHGKRFIIAEFLLLFVVLLLITNKITGKKFILLSIIMCVGIIGFSYVYGVFFKKNATSLVEYFSIDLSRHYTLIYQFYCQKNGIDISVNTFDAIIAILFFMVPRSLWIQKPYPFSNAITRSLIGYTPANVNLGWSTTVSIFCDLFDSLSYFGLILAAVLIYQMCKKVNKSQRIEMIILGNYLLLNLFTVQIVASLTVIIICYLVFKICLLFEQHKIYIGRSINNVISERR